MPIYLSITTSISTTTNNINDFSCSLGTSMSKFLVQGCKEV